MTHHSRVACGAKSYATLQLARFAHTGRSAPNLDSKTQATAVARLPPYPTKIHLPIHSIAASTLFLPKNSLIVPPLRDERPGILALPSVDDTKYKTHRRLRREQLAIPVGKRLLQDLRKLCELLDLFRRRCTKLSQHSALVSET